MHREFHCLQLNEIEAIFQRELTPDEAASLETHLAKCSTCREQIERSIGSAEWWSDVRHSLLAHQRSPQADTPSVMDETSLNWPQSAASISSDDNLTSQQTQQMLDLLGPTDDPSMLGRIDSYEVTGLLGHGGMGAVFKGFDRSLNRFVAIKMLLPHLATSGSARRRFAREAQAAAAVVDDHVMPVHYVGEWQGVPYLVMTYSKGTSLQTRLNQEGPLELKEILRVSLQSAKGLAAAHAQGLVHRDVKPANIFLSENVERVQLMDFGLARAVDDASLTRTGFLTGTPQYMSPEQARAESVDSRSDLFSLGSVMYAMCTGRPPFRADSSHSVLRLITDDEPRPIREINSDIPPWLATLIGKLMAKKTEDRIQSAEEVGILLEACLAHVQQPTEIELPEQVSRFATHEERAMDRSTRILSARQVLQFRCFVSIAAALPVIFFLSLAASSPQLTTAIGLVALPTSIALLAFAFRLLLRTLPPEEKKLWRTNSNQTPQNSNQAKRSNSTIRGVIAMTATAGCIFAGLLSFGAFVTMPHDVAGTWSSEQWGKVELKETSPGNYAGTYSGAFGSKTGTVELKWSRIERRYNGTWGAGDQRFGKLSLRRTGDQIRGAWTTKKRAKVDGNVPRLADLLWSRVERVSEDSARSDPVAANNTSERDPLQRAANEMLSLLRGNAESKSKAMKIGRWRRDLERIYDCDKHATTAIDQMFATDESAFFLTKPLKNTSGRYIIAEVLFTKDGDRWEMVMIDVEPADSGNRDIQRFQKEYPNAVPISFDLSDSGSSSSLRNLQGDWRLVRHIKPESDMDEPLSLGATVTVQGDRLLLEHNDTPVRIKVDESHSPAYFDAYAGNELVEGRCLIQGSLWKLVLGESRPNTKHGNAGNLSARPARVEPDSRYLYYEFERIPAPTAPPEAGRTKPGSIAVLPNGVSIEFVGMTKNTRSASEGWSSNGTALGDKVPEWPRGLTLDGGNRVSRRDPSEAKPDDNAVDFLFRIRGLKRQPSIKFDLPANGANFSHDPIEDPYLLRVSAWRRDRQTPPGAQYKNPNGVIGLAFTDEPWGKWIGVSPEELFVNHLAESDPYISFYDKISVASDPAGTRTRPGIAVLQPKDGSDHYRLEKRAFDSDGNERWVIHQKRGLDDRLEKASEIWRLAEELPNGKSIGRFEFRLRPYAHFVTFKNVAMHPDQRTEVSVSTRTVDTGPDSTNQSKSDPILHR